MHLLSSRWISWPLLCAALLSAPYAEGYHSDEQHITEDTAYVLRDSYWHVGLWKAEWGVHPRVQIGTYTWPWLLRVASLHAKWRLMDVGGLSLATRVGLFHFNTKNLERIDEETTQATLTVVPFDFLASYRFDSHYTLSLGTSYTVVRLRGTLDRERFFGAAEGAVDNLQLTAVFEWRQSRTTAWLLSGRYLVFQRGSGTARANYEVDDYTMLEVEGAAETDALDFKAAFSIMPGVVWSWEAFNLRLGLGYGNFNVPGVNFVVGQKSVVGDLGLYWIFD